MVDPGAVAGAVERSAGAGAVVVMTCSSGFPKRHGVPVGDRNAMTGSSARRGADSHVETPRHAPKRTATRGNALDARAAEAVRDPGDCARSLSLSKGPVPTGDRWLRQAQPPPNPGP
ncbi:hypothetical protein CHE218_18720 [Microbacterium sp. che218]